MSKASKRRRNAGRKRDPQAKRRTATTLVDRSPKDNGTQELQKMKLSAGSATVAIDFPLDVMFARRMITGEQYGAGRDFALLAWSLFGVPVAGCQALYERMLVGSAIPSHSTSEDRDEESAKKRRHEMRERHAGMLTILRASGNRRLLSAVQNATQYLHFPRYLVCLLTGLQIRPGDQRVVEDLRDGLQRLADAAQAARKQAA